MVLIMCRGIYEDWLVSLYLPVSKAANDNGDFYASS